ncbi:Phosphomannomutase/phosphoglucomutase [bacterium HR36]|nr:Phosphomannomutase/phosphoglucomutase [bacterium HR36]
MENSQPILSVSGIRGIVGASLTPELVARLVEIWSATFRGAVVLGRDSRPSGGELQEAARDVLLAGGHAVHEVGIVPTPTLGRAVRQLQARAGLQITASHNPPQWNGLKLFNAQGRALPPQEAAPLLQQFRAVLEADAAVSTSRSARSVADKRPSVESEIVDWRERALQEHVEAVLACVNNETIQRRRFRVLVDGNGGAGGPLATHLLHALGCQVVPVHCEPDGVFRHEPEPTPAALREIAPLVVQCGCDVGFALDSDADRLVLMDETGRCLSEEMTLALAAEARLRQRPGPIVANLSTSLMVEVLCQRRGFACYRTPVGEAHVVDGILASGAVLGGEGNGGVIDPRVGLVRDPFVGMALVLELLAELGKPLSTLSASLPAFVMRKEKHALEQITWHEVRKRLLAAMTGADVDDRDGLYFRWPDRWLHVRPSNTEPVVRILAEAPSAEQTDSLVQLARAALIA